MENENLEWVKFKSMKRNSKKLVQYRLDLSKLAINQKTTKVVVLESSNLACNSGLSTYHNYSKLDGLVKLFSVNNQRKETSYEKDSFVTVSCLANYSLSPEFTFNITDEKFLSSLPSVDNYLKNQNSSVWSGRDSNPYFSGDKPNSLPINLPPRSGAAFSLYQDENKN